MGIAGVGLVVAVAVAGVTTNLLAIVAWWNRRHPGVFRFAIHSGTAGLWSFVALAAITSSAWTVQLTYFSNGISMTVTLAWFLFIAESLGYGGRFSRRSKQLFLAGFGGIYFILFATTPATGLMTADPTVTAWSGLSVLDPDLTAVGLPFSLFGLALFFTGLSLLVRETILGDRLRRTQATVIFVATVIPVVAAVVLLLPTFPTGRLLE